jgi:2-polyprenyl-3-methyl-5-hydroxy-6-metoxy-1,4-benzoquinol methylase
MSQEVHAVSKPLPADSLGRPALSCHLCGNVRVDALFSEGRQGRVYTSYHCPACDLYQTLGEVEPVSPDYIDLVEEDLDPAHRFLQTAHKLPAFLQWRALVTNHLKNPLEKSTVLDIGCGIGGFLDFARSLDLTTFGFDASKAHAKEAQSQHSSVRHAISSAGYFQALGFRPQIDLVTLWDVFEHVRDPAKFLADIHDVLRTSNGTLFISVPSGAMNPTKVRIARARKRPVGLIPWEHVFYYTPKSLRRVTEEAGFDVLDLGGVQPYIRQPLTMHEALRRTAHHALRNTSHALQIYVLARPRQTP